MEALRSRIFREEALRHHEGTDVDYAVNVWSKTF